MKKIIQQLSLVIFSIVITTLGLTTNVKAQETAENKPLPANITGNSGTSLLEDVRQILRQQQDEIKQMRTMLEEQTRIIEDLRRRVAVTEAPLSANSQTQKIAAAGPQEPSDTRLAKVESQARATQESLTKQLGNINVSGEVRMRYEPFFGLQNSLPNGDNPSVAGNPLSARHRPRLRAQLTLSGKISNEFSWGLRLATGGLADDISTNQTLGDFFDRKQFALDQAYLAWTPTKVPGLRLQGGKFEVPWTRTQMTIDNDLQVEGISETYARNFKDRKLSNLTFVAWQLPILERNSGFVRNANGTVNVDESRRAGRDLALYGAQARGRFTINPNAALTVSLANLYFSGTQFISPIQVFGSNLQLPVTVTLPNGQTANGVATIPRDFLVAGNGLGISNASTNAVNRDGRLSSGYNLVDFITRLDLTRSTRWPVTLLLNLTKNTQTHDVIVAGANNANAFLRNRENFAYWAEFSFGRLKERGDSQFNYTFMRIQKDAVLTPFNFSDIATGSDIRAHRVAFTFQADPRVLLGLTSVFSQRPNGLLGPFSATPPGSLNRINTRLQIDTTFRF